MKNRSASFIPSLQAQMQWYCGQPQFDSQHIRRVIFDFNNDENVLDRKSGEYPNVVELRSALQESTICNTETGEIALIFNGNDIYDHYKNKVNDTMLETMQDSYLTSIIAPNLKRRKNAYNVYYINNATKHIEYSIVEYSNGVNSPASFIGTETVESSETPSPLGLACVNETEYWLLALRNAHTLCAYKFDNSNTIYPTIYVTLEPFVHLVDTELDCRRCSILSFGKKIAITVNGSLMTGEIDFSGTTGFSITEQSFVSDDAISLIPSFNKTATKLYFLKKTKSEKDHIFVYELNSMVSYSADSDYIFKNEYLSLKLAPNGKIYGTNTFTSNDPLLMLEEIPSVGKVSISEIITEDIYSSATFGNIQYEINDF